MPRTISCWSAISNSRILLPLVATILWSSVSVLPASAQTTFGSITGVVTDPSGAAIPRVQITVVNEDTGLTRRQATTVTGVYTMPDLAPGKYRVRFEGSGFNSQEKQGVLLDANHVVTVDAQLAVGMATTRVDVQGTVPIITTETATTSYVKTDAQLLESAVNVRQGNSTQGFVMYNQVPARLTLIGPMMESSKCRIWWAPAVPALGQTWRTSPKSIMCW
jgi:hypothetical protein